MAYIGWLLSAEDRASLLKKFEPAYSDVIAHHITFSQDTKLALPDVKKFEVVGIADDLNGVQALVIALDGNTARTNGRHYHITWSIDRAKGCKPVDSNAVIAAEGWVDVDKISITCTPFNSATDTVL